jgi:DNA invertase Pin-like site-specific DNA recombinase
MSRPPIRRCAIYTRKSSEEGLDQEFNSLDAQRAACEAFIASQTHEGWRLVPAAYDDPGFSGGTLKRPALQHLLADVEAGKVDIIVVYKVDRLTRSLADFARIVGILDAHAASFVSVTQAFNTTTSMGRLTLNVLLSFAQFEREVTGERIRDKFAASRAKGIWMGGFPPLGYDIRFRKLLVNQHEADQVRTIFARYLELGSVAALTEDLRRRGIRSKSWTTQGGVERTGKQFGRGALYALLKNRVYLGEAVHKGKVYPGEHEAIVTRDLWERVQARLDGQRRERSALPRVTTPHLLAGLLFDDRGNPMSPSHARKRSGKRYRYYVSQAVLKHSADDAGTVARVPAHEIETLVERRIAALLAERERAPWDKLSPAAKVRRLAGLLRRIVIRSGEVEIAISDEAFERGVLADAGPATRGERLVEGSDCTSLVVPIRLRTWNGERLIEGPNGETAQISSRPDRALIRAIVRAHGWRAAAEAREADSLVELANVAGCTERYVRQLFPLAFLAPDIVDAILAGRQPRRLSLALMLQTGIPLSWRAQRAAFGFANPL